MARPSVINNNTGYYDRPKTGRPVGIAPTKTMKKMQDNSLFDRVVLILEQARDNVVRAVNSSMVTAYWLIGREI